MDTEGMRVRGICALIEGTDEHWLPLRRRDGSLASFALVDAETYRWAKEVSWHLRPGGYASRPVNTPAGQRAMLLHRAVAGACIGEPVVVDHINGVRLDCRGSNLRKVTTAQNAQNRRPWGDRNSSSRYRGVSWHKTKCKWQAYCCLDGRIRHIGYFIDEDEAGRAASEFRAKHMPFSSDAGAA